MEPQVLSQASGKFMIYTLILHCQLHKAFLSSGNQPVVTRLWAQLLEDDGVGFSQLEYTTHLVFPHMDVKRVIIKFYKDLKSGIMNQTAPKLHIRSETSDGDP